MGRKATIWILKRQTGKIVYEKTKTWLRKRNLRKETEFLLIEAQKNTIRTNYVSAEINNTQQKSNCKLFGDRDDTVNYISEYSKLV